MITPSGICPTKQRIIDVFQAPVPANKSELKSFLGLMTYIAKFIPCVASLLHPTPTKRLTLSKALVLVHYDVNKPIKLHCDA